MTSSGVERINVVLDINVFLDYIGRADGRILLPTPEDMPTNSPAADTLALAFDDRYSLFASPHILRNINRVMHAYGQSEKTRQKYIEFIVETCALTGGAIVDPIVRDHAIGDHEDNHILALAKDPAVNADVIVSSDRHLVDLGPAWNGRLILRPHQFTAHLLRAPLPQPAEPALAPKPSQPRMSPPPSPNRGAAAFPELRGVRLDRYGLAGDDRQADPDASLER